MKNHGGLPYPESLRGKRVRVVLDDGTVFVDRVARGGKSRFWIFEEHGRIKPSDIIRVSIHRGEQEATP